jgi:hypothetical protein
MTFPVLVTHANGTFTASTLGTPSVSAAGATKEAAVAAVTAQLRAGAVAAEVVFVDVDADAPTDYPITDPAAAWRELCADVYRERAAQKAAEFAE